MEEKMTEIVPSILLQLFFIAIGGVIAYSAGWVFSHALDDVERVIRIIRKFLSVDVP